MSSARNESSSDQAFGNDTRFWSDVNLVDAKGDTQTEVLVNRCVKIIGHHIVNVMKWRKTRIEFILDTEAEPGEAPPMKTALLSDSKVDVTCQKLNSFAKSCAVSCAKSFVKKEDNGCHSLLSNEDEMNNRLPQLVMEELFQFVSTIASKYNKVMYHNFEHASHVTACVHQIVMMLNNNTRESNNLSSFSNGRRTSVNLDINNSFIATNPMVHLAIVVTALIHDVEHQGVGNKQLVDENSPLAVKYNGVSVAENNSYESFTEILQQDKYYNLRQSMFGDFDDVAKAYALENLHDNDAHVKDTIKSNLESFKSLFHQVSHDIIMATDISDPSKIKKGKAKWVQAFEGVDPIPDDLSLSSHPNLGSPDEDSDSKPLSRPTNRRSSLTHAPARSYPKMMRRQSFPANYGTPTIPEFIADPVPDRSHMILPREFSWKSKLNLNGSTKINCPLCHKVCSRNEAFKCSSYLRLSAAVEQIIQTADVGHTMQSWPVFVKWNEKLYNELWVASLAKRGPACLGGWFNGQIGFYDNYIFPLAERMQRCGIFGDLGAIFYENAVANKNQWIVEGEELCKEMHKKATQKFGADS